MSCPITEVETRIPQESTMVRWQIRRVRNQHPINIRPPQTYYLEITAPKNVGYTNPHTIEDEAACI